MEPLQYVAYLMVIAATGVYLWKNLKQYIVRSLEQRIDSINEQFNNKLEEVEQSITLKFDLWWNEHGKPKVEEHFKSDEAGGTAIHLAIGPFGPMPGFDGDPRVEMVRQSALHFATLLASKDVHDKHVNMLYRLGSAKAKQSVDEQREKHLDKHREMLIQAGVSVPEFEAEFTP